MRISGLLAGRVDYPRAIHIYRVTLPLSYINKEKKHQAGWTDSINSLFNLTKEQMKFLSTSDIIVLGRPVTKDYRAAYKYIQTLKEYGARVVYETDDDLTETYRDISNGKEASSIPYLPYVDAITVTTQPLADRLAQYTDRPIYVVNNYLEQSFFRKVSMSHKRINTGTTNIMLLGTMSHSTDWELAYLAISKILDEYPQSKLIMGGYKPEYVKREEQMGFIPYQAYLKYPTMLAEADIVVAAIDPEDKFNHCKSAVKAMEAWAAAREVGNTIGGAAVVATNSIVYNPVVTNMRNGILVNHTVDDYYNGIKFLLDNTQDREAMQRRGFLDGVKNHSMATGYTKWLSIYKRILRS